nr:MAG TPA: hypothetical protein [Crassvirales sp.]
MFKIVLGLNNLIIAQPKSFIVRYFPTRESLNIYKFASNAPTVIEAVLRPSIWIEPYLFALDINALAVSLFSLFLVRPDTTFLP